MGRKLLKSVEQVARMMGRVALTHYRAALEVETKPDGSPVTAADRGAEQMAREWLRAQFPEDGILGEELGETPGTSGRQWILDPIDGTQSFIRGVPLWGSLVAVVEDEKVLAGAAFFPAVDECLAAAPGQGCWWNGQRASVSKTSTLAGATVLITDERRFGSAEMRDRWRTLIGEVSLSRSWGDCFGYLLVATGRADAMVDPIVNPWDTACFQPIIEEAGGVFTDIGGARTPFSGSAIATNAAIADAVRDYLAP